MQFRRGPAATRRAMPKSQPASDPRPWIDLRPADQYQESGLEGVVGVLEAWQGPPANAQHHRPVTFDERGERRVRFLSILCAKNRSSSKPSVSDPTAPKA